VMVVGVGDHAVEIEEDSLRRHVSLSFRQSNKGRMLSPALSRKGSRTVKSLTSSAASAIFRFRAHSGFGDV
jgi:hypothetical protein